jgi:hypothetical protein
MGIKWDLVSMMLSGVRVQVSSEGQRSEFHRLLFPILVEVALSEEMALSPVEEEVPAIATAGTSALVDIDRASRGWVDVASKDVASGKFHSERSGRGITQNGRTEHATEASQSKNPARISQGR